MYASTIDLKKNVPMKVKVKKNKNDDLELAQAGSTKLGKFSLENKTINLKNACGIESNAPGTSNGSPVVAYWNSCISSANMNTAAMANSSTNPKNHKNKEASSGIIAKKLYAVFRSIRDRTNATPGRTTFGFVYDSTVTEKGGGGVGVH